MDSNLPRAATVPRPRVQTAAQTGGVTARAVALATVLLALIALLNFFVEIDWGINWSGSWSFSSGVPALVPVSVLVALTALGGLLGRAALSRRELLAVYCAVLVGAPVLTSATLAWLLVKNVAYFYTARAQPEWEAAFLRYVPAWWAPGDRASVEGFFEGNASVPWGAWATPLLAWGAFSLALFLCTLCVMVLLQRQWVTHERLTFPVAQVALETVRERGGGGRLPRGWPFWIGLLVAFGVNFLSSLADKVPALPKIPLSAYDLIPWQRTGPLAGLGSFSLILWPWMVALAYLIPKDLSFSVWFFSLVRIGLTVAAIAAGATPVRPEEWWTTSFPAPYYQGGGAVVALSLWVLWIGRRHLARAARQVVRPTGEDAAEPLSYRTACAGFAVSLAFLVYFLVASQCRVLFSLVLMLVTIGYFAIWARIRAETGLGILCFPLQIQDVAMVPFGSRAFRPAELVALVSLRAYYTPGFSSSFEIFPGSVLESFKIADAAGLNQRRLSGLLIGGFAISLIVGILIFMTGVYRLGWFGLNCSRGGWLGPQSIGDGGRIVSFLNDAAASKPDVNGLLALAAGGAVTILLGLLRLRFWWWPFHPVGYLASNTWGSHWWCVPFLIGWVGKMLVTRYGGLRLYRQSVPLAIGLIVGDMLNGGVWAMVRVATLGGV